MNYKLTHTFKKHPERLLNYGFGEFKTQDGNETFYSYPLYLSQNNPLVIKSIKLFETAYSKSSDNDKKQLDPKYQFDSNGKLIITDEIRDEFCSAHLCVDTDSTIFLNSSLQTAYYDIKSINSCCPDLIQSLLQRKVIKFCD